MRDRCLNVLLLGAIALSAFPAQADPPTTPANTWVTGRAVRAIVRVGDRLFVGGDFTNVHPRSRYTGSLATFVHGEEDPTTLPALSGGPVTALTDDGAGGWFAAGTFTHAGNTALDLTGAPRLVHLRPDGSVRQLLGLAGTEALTLARSGSTLMLGYVRVYYAGRLVFFEYLIAPFDAVTGERRAPDIVANSVITTMVADSARIYVFGQFSRVAGAARAGAAAFEASSLMLTPWAPALSLVDSAELDGTTVFLAGGFTAVGGQPRQGLAAVSTTDGALLPWAPSAPCPVSAIAAGPGAVFLGGCHRSSSGVRPHFLIAVDRVTGAEAGWSAVVDGPVTALHESGSHLYVAGGFSSIDGEARLHVAAFANNMLAPWNPRASAGVSVIASTPDHVAVGGDLTGLGAVARPGLAEFDARTGALSPWVPPGIDHVSVRSLASDGRWLFVGTGSPPCWFGCDLLALALDGSGSVTVPHNTEVQAAASTRDRLYIGGAFGLIAFDTHTATQLPWQVPINIRAILATDAALYAVPYESATAGHVVKIDPRSGQVLPWGPVVTPAPIGGLALSGPSLLVAIASTTSTGSALIAVDQATGAVVAEAPRSLVSAIDVYPAGPSWSPLINPPPWAPLTAGLAASPRGVLLSSHGTLMGLHPATGTRLPWSVQLDGPAQSLYADDRVVVAGGDFAHAGAVASPGLAIFPEWVPPAPSNLVASVSGAEVWLEWTPPIGGDPTEYRLEAGTLQGGSDVGAWILPPTPSYRVAGVPDGRYFVRVRAATGAGVSPPSNEVEVIVGVPQPLAPTGLIAAVDAQTVSLTWSAVAGPLDQYVLDVGSAPGLSDLVRGAPLGPATSARFERVPAGRYYARVRAINRTGSSPPSAEVTVIVAGTAAQRTR